MATTDMHPPYPALPGDELARARWQRMWSHREQLLRVARRRSMSAEDAEDAVQEAMLRAAENPHLDDARLGAWLTTVTMRLCVDRYRQVNREAQVRSSPTLTAPGPVPVDEAVCDRAEAKWLAFQSRELPARQAEALRLKAQDRDVGQVATEMGLSYQAVESLLARARRTLRNSLAGTLGLALWLCGRGRTQAGGNVQAVAAASTAAATLAVMGLVLPFAYEPDEPRAPRGATTSEVADAMDTTGQEIPPAASGRADRGAADSASPAGSVPPSPGASPSGLLGVLPEVAEVPEVGVPEVPEVPEVPGAAVPDVPGVPVPEVAVPEVAAREVAVPEVPVPEVSPSLPTVSGPALPTTGSTPTTSTSTSPLITR
ncbi:RNA polymerase sigma factor [Streptomyces sp. ISL-98]|uniref:RNA polymerase sigma factor n=1 Tax=Streptomyces sp. ISL-98 TaxID=2819192 RepID=UPI002035F177|nr:sigma-70 family RNA polymerase sigma factor [Streptomyces sp. ISL-98]